MVLCSTTQTHLLPFVRLRHDYLCVSPASTSLTHTLDPSLTGNGHFAVPISLCTSPHPPPPPPRFLHTGNRSQIISSTLRATRQLLSLLWSPPVAPVSLAPSSSSEWTFLCYRYSSGAKGGVGVIPPTAVSPRDSCLYYRRRATLDLSANQKRSRLFFAWSRVRSSAIVAIWMEFLLATPPGHLLRWRQVEGGGVCWCSTGHVSVCSSHSGFIK